MLSPPCTKNRGKLQAAAVHLGPTWSPPQGTSPPVQTPGCLLASEAPSALVLGLLTPVSAEPYRPVCLWLEFGLSEETKNCCLFLDEAPKHHAARIAHDVGLLPYSFKDKNNNSLTPTVPLCNRDDCKFQFLSPLPSSLLVISLSLSGIVFLALCYGQCQIYTEVEGIA